MRRFFAKLNFVFVAIFALSGGIASAHGDENESVVLINTFAVPAGKTEEAIAMWEAARDFMREQDGYLSTKLHLSLSEDARYRLVNVAEWESIAQYRTAAQKLRESGVFRAPEGVRAAPHLYSVIREDD